MGVDWRELDWKEYQMTVAAYDAVHDAGKPASDLSELRRFMDAHSVH